MGRGSIHLQYEISTVLVQCNYILLSQVYCVRQDVKTPSIIFNNPVYIFTSTIVIIERISWLIKVIDIWFVFDLFIKIAILDYTYLLTYLLTYSKEQSPS